MSTSPSPTDDSGTFSFVAFCKAYEEACEANGGVKPKRAVHEALEKSSSGSPVELPGNALRLFNSRLRPNDLQAILQALKACDFKITSLNLSCNELGDEGAAILSRELEDDACTIQELNLASNGIGSKGCIKLADVVRENASLLSLNLNGNPIGKAGGMAISRMIHSNTSLQSIDIGNTEQNTDSIVAIAIELHTNASITRANLDNPRLFSFYEETTKHIARMLRVNETLVELSLEKHNIRDDGVRIIGECLREAKRSKLASLNLRCNQISFGGAHRVADLLTDATNLQRLNLENNRIRDEGARAIGRALALNCNLTHLNISCNGIRDKGLSAIANGMHQNASIVELKLWANAFGPLSSEQFYGLVEGRFKYYCVSTDIEPYKSEDGVVQVARRV